MSSRSTASSQSASPWVLTVLCCWNWGFHNWLDSSFLAYWTLVFHSACGFAHCPRFGISYSLKLVEEKSLPEPCHPLPSYHTQDPCWHYTSHPVSTQPSTEYSETSLEIFFLFDRPLTYSSTFSGYSRSHPWFSIIMHSLWAILSTLPRLQLPSNGQSLWNLHFLFLAPELQFQLPRWTVYWTGQLHVSQTFQMQKGKACSSYMFSIFRAWSFPQSLKLKHLSHP